ncbi:MAG: glycoside hydrolase family 32 protein [Eubacterium sp.]|nr:glycoside hydrolase family 32 protein [Eubacterium sp.]
MKNAVHLKSPQGWINDPNGFIYYKGEYHLFYQHFPYAPVWGRMHWGHAVSNDLLHWEHKSIALFPSKKDDRSGCFSGSAVEHDGKLYLFYTGVNYTEEDPENINLYLNNDFTAAQLMITSDDGVRFDNINDKRTVIPPLTDKNIGCGINTRDPKVWRGNDAWYMVLGSTSDNKGRVLLYKSTDLTRWEYMSFAEKDGFGWGWECPDYFKVDESGVLIISPMGFINGGKKYNEITVCVLADFSEKDCTMRLSDNYQLLDCGQDLYAPQSTTDEDGRRILVAWARMPEPMDGFRIGMFCMPRIVEVKNKHIYFRPHPNVEGRFTKKISDTSEADENGYKIVLELKNGDSIDIGGYVLERRDNKIYADRSAVFAGHDEIKCRFKTPEICDGERLDIYVDKNLIEVYINNGEYVLTNVVYGLSGDIRAKDYELYTIAY